MAAGTQAQKSHYAVVRAAMRPTRALVAALALAAMQSVVAVSRLDPVGPRGVTHAAVAPAAVSGSSSSSLVADGMRSEEEGEEGEEDGDASRGEEAVVEMEQDEHRASRAPAPAVSTTDVLQATKKSPQPPVTAATAMERVHAAITDTAPSAHVKSSKPPTIPRSRGPRPIEKHTTDSSRVDHVDTSVSDGVIGIVDRPSTASPTKKAAAELISSGSLEVDDQPTELDDGSNVDEETPPVGDESGESDGSELEPTSVVQFQDDDADAVAVSTSAPTRAAVNVQGGSSGEVSKMVTPELFDLSGDVIKLPTAISISSATTAQQQFHVEDKSSDQSAKGIFIHFMSLRMNEGDRIILKSNQGDQQVIAHSAGGPIWSRRLMGHAVTIRFLPSANGGGSGEMDVTVDSYRVFRGHVTKEELCGEDDSRPVKCFLSVAPGDASKYIKAQAVARVLVDGSIPCSGALLGASGEYFLTAGHCIKKDEQARTLQLEFGAESSSCLSECKTQMGCIGSDIVIGTELYYVSRDLDFAILKVDPTSAKPLVAKFGHLTLREAGPTIGEELYIAHHPNAYAKRISAKNGSGEITAQALKMQRPGCGPKTAKDHIAYASDTIGGSSGAPVIASSDNRVVGVHLCGGCSTQGVNSGVSARAIISELKAKGKLQKAFVL